MRTSTKWISDNEWTCNRHIPMSRYPKRLQRCWYCSAERPPLDDRKQGKRPRRPAESVPPQVFPPAVHTPMEKCAWHECSNTRSAKSKYCSRECSNKNARARYSARVSRNKPGNIRETLKGNAPLPEPPPTPIAVGEETT